jgi:DNA invertase Pin-like site-specific DNA recombinase
MTMVATINNHQDSGKHDALYARYSSHSQDDSTSIAVQIESCERMAGRKLVHFIDQAKTGRTTGGRTELLRLIQEAEAGRIGKLYVYKFDRLGRAAETHVLVEDLERCGVEVVSVTEGTNALARGVQLVVAADYSRVLAERTRAGLIQRHKEGCWTGGPAPYGYQVIAAPDGKKKLGDSAGGGGSRSIPVHKLPIREHRHEGTGAAAAPEKHSNPLGRTVAIHDVAQHSHESDGGGRGSILAPLLPIESGYGATASPFQ